MADRWTITLLSAFTLALGTLACERTDLGQRLDSATAPPASAPPVTTGSGDSALLYEAVEAYAARSMYARWAPDSADAGRDPVCRDPRDEERFPYAAWGIARARVIRLSFDDSTRGKASADLEVVRVLSIEGVDDETTYGKDPSTDMMLAWSDVDTLDVRFRRRPDGRWTRCELLSHDVTRLGKGVLNPIVLTGPPADTLAPRGKKLARIYPEGVTWQRLREVAAELSTQPSPVRITPDSLGGQPLWIPLAEVLRRWPGAERRGWSGYEVGYPAIGFTVGELSVLAVQTNEAPEGADTLPSLDLTKHPDFYAIEGSTGELVGLGVTTGTRWVRLRPALGDIRVYAEGAHPVHVRPCRFPWMILGFDSRFGWAARDRERTPDGSFPPDILPDSARPHYMHIRRTKELAAKSSC